MEQEAREALEKGVKLLAMSTHAHVLEQAQQKLHSRLSMFKDGLEYQETDNVYSIIIPDKIGWIEEGLPARNLKDVLLKSPKAKTGKNGKYMSIPFKHDKAPSQQTPIANSITGTLRAELKQRGIPYKPLERDAAGNVRTGKIHSNMNLGGLQRGATEINPAWKNPALKGTNIYQHDKGGGRFGKDIMTFRTISENSEGWNAPALEGGHFLDEASTWAETQWESNILPDILGKLTGK